MNEEDKFLAALDRQNSTLPPESRLNRDFVLNAFRRATPEERSKVMAMVDQRPPAAAPAAAAADSGWETIVPAKPAAAPAPVARTTPAPAPTTQRQATARELVSQLLLPDVARETGRGARLALERTGAALGQMATEVPVAVAQAAGVEVSPETQQASQVFRRQATRIGQEQAQLRQTSPVGAVAGEALGGLALVGAAAPLRATAAAPGGPVSGLARAGMAGGVGAVATEPATSPTTPIIEEKTEQFGAGAATGAALAGTLQAGGAALQAGKRYLFGTPSPTQQQLWNRAKALGFEIAPSQARQEATRVLQAGTYPEQGLRNQAVANQLASRTTGLEVRALTPDFFSDRYRTLGAEYGKIYTPGTRLKVDVDAIRGLRDVVQQEERMGRPWMVNQARDAANRLIAEFDIQQARAGTARVRSVNIDASELQRLMTNLKDSQSSFSGSVEGRIIGDVVDDINQSISRNHPALRAKLNVLNPQYRALLTLDEARKIGAVDTQGNVSAIDLGRLLNRTDPRYRSDLSTNPLAELGRLGETFGIRGVGQATVTGGQAAYAGGRADILPATRAGAIRMATQQATDNPLTRRMFEGYIRNPQRTPMTPQQIEAAGATGGMAAEELEAPVERVQRMFLGPPQRTTPFPMR